ncbi:UM00103-like protein [Meredithblackwellia eburnea MCA 4105]
MAGPPSTSSSTGTAVDLTQDDDERLERDAVLGTIEAAAKLEKTHSGVSVPADADVAPEGGYGWVVVLCTMGINSVTWGVNTTYGVYSSFYLQHSYFHGGSTMRYAYVGGLSVSTAVALAPLSNYLNKSYGFRVPLILGTICVVLGQCCAGIAPNFGVFLFCQGVRLSLAQVRTFPPSLPIALRIGQLTISHRRNQQGISAAGTGFGGMIFSNVTRVTIEKLGVKWALIINGCASLVVLTPSVLLLKSRKSVQAKNEPLQLKWIFHPGFFWVWTWGALGMIGNLVALYTLVSFATNGLGLSQAQGAALQSMLAGGQVIGRPLCGYLTDKGGRLNFAMILQVIAGLSCLVIWLPARSFGVLALFAWVQGLVGGTLWALVAPVTARVVSVRDMNSAMCIFWLSCAIPAQFSQPLAILLLNYSKHHLGRTGADAYLISIGFCGAAFTVSGLLMFGAKWHHQGNPRLWVKS